MMWYYHILPVAVETPSNEPRKTPSLRPFQGYALLMATDLCQETSARWWMHQEWKPFLALRKTEMLRQLYRNPMIQVQFQAQRDWTCTRSPSPPKLATDIPVNVDNGNFPRQNPGKLPGHRPLQSPAFPISIYLCRIVSSNDVNWGGLRRKGDFAPNLSFIEDQGRGVHYGTMGILGAFRTVNSVRTIEVVQI